MARPNRYLPQLDGLRALAVVIVVVFHARATLAPGGYVGVDVFFVLSGFLITSLLVAELDGTGRVRFARFYLRRAARLAPALLAVCAVVGLAAWALPGLANRSATGLGTLTAVTYSSSPVAAAGVHLGAMLPTWSLSVEEYFYFVWPLVLVLAARRLRVPRVWLLLGLVAIAIAYRAMAWNVAHWSIDRISYAPDTRAEQLLIGCLLAVGLPYVARLSRRAVGWLAVPAVVVLAAMVVAPGTRTFEAYAAGGSTVIALAAAGLVAHLVLVDRSPLCQLLGSRPLVWIGQRSYGIYLWNVPVISLVAATALPDRVQLVVKLVLIVVIPAVSYRFLEQPVRQWWRRREAAQSETARGPAAAVAASPNRPGTEPAPAMTSSATSSPISGANFAP